LKKYRLKVMSGQSYPNTTARQRDRLKETGYIEGRNVPTWSASGRPNGSDHPETNGTSFTFLGFTHIWGKSRAGKNVVRQVTAKNRYAHALAAVTVARCFMAFKAAWKTPYPRASVPCFQTEDIINDLLSLFGAQYEHRHPCMGRRKHQEQSRFCHSWSVCNLDESW
jgi:hypothetical protein